MLNKHELPVAKEETERCDTLRYSWERLNATAAEVQSHLLAIQPNFKSELIQDVKVFIEDCNNFYSDYDKVRAFHFFKVPVSSVRQSIAYVRPEKLKKKKVPE